jgi:Leucine rich repeat
LENCLFFRDFDSQLNDKANLVSFANFRILDAWCSLYFINFYRLYFTILGVVRSEQVLNLTCSNHHCVFQSVNADFDINYQSVDLKSAKTLKFQNSSFENFPKHVAKNFVELKELQATDCNMSTLGGNFIFYEFTKNQLLNLTTVDFSRNQLLNVEPLTRLSNLKQANLSSNQIGELHNRSFTGLRELEVLDLGSNNISKIAPDAFTPVKNLKKVILVNNQLTELPEKVFSVQADLIEIDLAHNLLTTFDLGVFGSTWYLERLNLAGNNMQLLQYLSPSPTLKKLVINVTDNKWNCFYAQHLEIQALKYNQYLIGNFDDCLPNWLDATNEKWQKQQNKTIAELRQKFVEQGKNFTGLKMDSETMIAELRQQLVGQSENAAELKLDIEKLKHKVAKYFHLEKDVTCMIVGIISLAIDGAVTVAFMKIFQNLNFTIY